MVAVTIAQTFFKLMAFHHVSAPQGSSYSAWPAKREVL